MPGLGEPGRPAGPVLTPYRDDDRADASAFVTRARRVDDSGVVRLRRRAGDRVGLWVRTGFDVLVTRAVFGNLDPGDVVCDAAALAGVLDDPTSAVPAGQPVPPLTLTAALPIAWQGALPPEAGFAQVDDVPAAEVIEVARRGAEVAETESGALGPASSLLDQEVLQVSGADGQQVGITMRTLFALSAMSFVGQSRDEIVRVRATASWARVDGRYGSVYQRRSVLNVSVL